LEAYSLIEFKKNTIKDIEDFEDLASEHWNSFNNKPPKFNKDILQNFSVIQATHKSKTIGYILYVCFKAPYYDEVWCQVDMFYLKPEYRGQGTGKQMFKMMEAEAKELGASKIMSSFNLKQPLEGFYKNMGYIETHVAVAKEI
jgi:GNAT superfamily N-acetyltransferase